MSVCVQESYRQVMRLRPKDLRKKLMIRFRHEDGVDYGGIARWVELWVGRGWWAVGGGQGVVGSRWWAGGGGQGVVGACERL